MVFLAEIGRRRIFRKHLQIDIFKARRLCGRCPTGRRQPKTDREEAMRAPTRARGVVLAATTAMIAGGAPQPARSGEPPPAPPSLAEVTAARAALRSGVRHAQANQPQRRGPPPAVPPRTNRPPTANAPGPTTSSVRSQYVQIPADPTPVHTGPGVDPQHHQSVIYETLPSDPRQLNYTVLPPELHYTTLPPELPEHTNPPTPEHGAAPEHTAARPFSPSHPFSRH